MAIDNWFQYHINHWAASTELGRLSAQLFGYCTMPDWILMGIFVFLWFSPPQSIFGRDRLFIQQRLLLFLITCVPVDLVLRIIQRAFHRLRPAAVFPLEPIGELDRWNILTHSFSHPGSFPSDHAGLFGMFVVILFSIHRWLGLGGLIVFSYFALIRVAMGFHWVSDIVVGAFLGAAMTLLALYLQPKFEFRLTTIVKWIETYQQLAYTVGFLFISDFAFNFTFSRTIFAYVLNLRIDHP